MKGSWLVRGRISCAIRSHAVSLSGRGMLGACWMMPQISASAVQMLPPMPIREFWLPLVWSKLICRLDMASGATRRAVSRLSFSSSIAPITDVRLRTLLARASRLSWTKPSTLPTAPATAATACWSSSLSAARVRETPARSLMNARTSLSFSASVVVNSARWVTVSNNGPAPSPKAFTAAESSRSIALPFAPCPWKAFRPAFSRLSSVPSALTPLGPSAWVSVCRLP